jgi:hypothetical protein
MDREEDVKKYFGNGYVTESESGDEYDTEEEENYQALDERQLLCEIEGNCDEFEYRGESLVDLFYAHDSDGDVIMCV